MPLTPFHFGPGAFIKSLMPRWFSFRAFLLSQLIMDFETAWNIFWGNDRLHTLFHSYLGSSIVIILTIAVIIAYNFVFLNGLGFRLPAYSFWRPFEFKSAIIAVVIGAWSHVFLDSIMHMDMMPLKPFSDLNPSLNFVSVFTLHIACLFGFILAAIIYGFRYLVELLLRSSKSGRHSNFRARFWRGLRAPL
jgi:hypothetical protein